MFTNKFKPFVPHIVAVVIFITITSIYFYPQLEGLRLRQGDTEQHIGMSKEISDFREKYRSEPLWTNSTFCGMPAYQVSTLYSNEVVKAENKLLDKILPRPIGYIVLAMVAFYILLLCFEVNPWTSIIGAIAFGLASFNMLYLEAGHNSKVHAVALLPLVFGSLMLAYRKNYFMGAILLAFSLCLVIGGNHIQMSYYAAFLVAFIIIAELILHLLNKSFLKFLKVSAVLIVAAIIGILPSFSNLYTTYEYGKYSTRGKTELTVSPPSEGEEKEKPVNALESWYITQHDLGYGEVWSLVIPNVKGGAPNYIGNIEDAVKNVDPAYAQYVAERNAYWGEQSATGGAFYFGAVIFVLFVLGMVFIRDQIKWAFFAAFILAVILSWKYSGILDFFINHFPLFNKFRDTKMILILVQMIWPLIGLLFIKELFNNQIKGKKLLYTLIAVNGLLLLFYLTPGTFFDFVSSRESDEFNKQLTSLENSPKYDQFRTFISELENARMVIFKKDTLRSLFFALMVSGLVFAFAYGKIKKNYFLAILGLLVLIDLWVVDKRYLNNEKYGNSYKMWVQKQRYSNPYRASNADTFILNNEMRGNPSLYSKIEEAINKPSKNTKPQDLETKKQDIIFSELNFNTDYRVLTLEKTKNPFSDGSISYFHKSLGGYHGAKLKKYQELLDFYVNNEYSIAYSTIHSLREKHMPNELIAEALKTRIPLLDMLNTKYLIYDADTVAFNNPYANGYCWVVKDIKYAENADDEMLSLGKVNLKTTVVVNKKYKGEIKPFQYDSTTSIKLNSCLPNHLSYTYKSAAPQLVVFSEIYYPKGWNAYIDGKKAPYFSANYILRAMCMPAGEHTIEYRFEPQSFYVGEKISLASSILLFVLLIGAISFEVYKKIKPAN
jgi:hypothetical protein